MERIVGYPEVYEKGKAPGPDGIINEMLMVYEVLEWCTCWWIY